MPPVAGRAPRAEKDGERELTEGDLRRRGGGAGSMGAPEAKKAERMCACCGGSSRDTG